MENVELKNTPLKLSYKRTLIIAFAFFGILMLWQVYNTYCPVMLSDLLVEFGDKNHMFEGMLFENKVSSIQWLVGIIMALDNVFAIFMLPLFGFLSDKTKSKHGKRMPYIVIGTILSAIAMPLLPLAFYFNSLVGLIIVMILVLVFMNAYRNPAVSLMPDLTPKPLRAKANGLINLIGYVGAIIAGALALIFTTTKYFVPFKDEGGVDVAVSTFKSFEMFIPFIIASICMVVTMIILALNINENRLEAELKDDMARGEKMAEVVEPLKQDDKLTKNNKRNLILMIVAIFLWFAGFNAVETFWSNYASFRLDGFSNYSLATIVLTICSLVTFIPAGMLASKIGRKWTVMLGIVICAFALLGCFFISPLFIHNEQISLAQMILYFAFFGIAGVGWAFINCCSYPMVVELASQANIGKYTGYYYTSSMIAQSLTPVCLGLLIAFGPKLSFDFMFPYSTVLFIAAGVVFFFVNNSKTKAKAIKKGLEAFDND